MIFWPNDAFWPNSVIRATKCFGRAAALREWVSAAAQRQSALIVSDRDEAVAVYGLVGARPTER